MPKKYRLKLAHINDSHSHLEPSRIHFTLSLKDQKYDCYSHSGGCARIAYQLKQARISAKQSQQQFLFVHGGDSFHGTLYFNEFKGKANSHILNLLKPDAMVIGNHEIDAGSEPLAEFVNDIKFPLLAGNMDLTHLPTDAPFSLKGHPNLIDYDATNKIAKYITKPLQDKQLAIIGITLDQMADIARPDPAILFHDAVQTTANTIKHLNQQGIKHILLLSHLGIDFDRELAKQVNGISLIVGGHSHTQQGDFNSLGIDSSPYGEIVNNTPILHAGKHAETIGIADIEFDHTGAVIQLKGDNYFMLDKQFIVESNQGVTPTEYAQLSAQLHQHSGIIWDDEDAELQQILDQLYRPAIESMKHQILTFVPKSLIHTRLPNEELPHGSEIAPLVCKSIYHVAKAEHPEINFVLHNAGGVRHSLDKGQLTRADVMGRILPFDLPLVKYKIQGKHIYHTIESTINMATNNSVTGTGAGSFPYTYGLKYHYDGRRELGSRIVNLEVLLWQNDQMIWQKVDKKQFYFGLSSDYTIAGKEGYFPLLQAVSQQVLTELTLPSAFIRYINQIKTLPLDEPPQLCYTSHN